MPTFITIRLFLVITIISAKLHLAESSYSQPQIARPHNLTEFRTQRASLRDTQASADFQSDAPVLNAREKLANEIIVRLKTQQLDNGFRQPGQFLPAVHWFEALNATRSSKLFRCLRRMPKGGLLHMHDTGMASIDHMLNITYHPNLWHCMMDNNRQQSQRIQTFRFALRRPRHLQCAGEQGWLRTADERSRLGSAAFDAFVRAQFTLRTDYPYADINSVWKRFDELFQLADSLRTHVPVLREYFHQSLTEALADGVQYMEMRAVLSPLYDLDGTIRTNVTDLVREYIEIAEQF